MSEAAKSKKKAKLEREQGPRTSRLQTGEGLKLQGSTFGGGEVQGSVPIGVLNIAVTGGSIHQGLHRLGMPIGRRIVQRCRTILRLQLPLAHVVRFFNAVYLMGRCESKSRMKRAPGLAGRAQGSLWEPELVGMCSHHVHIL